MELNDHTRALFETQPPGKVLSTFISKWMWPAVVFWVVVSTCFSFNQTQFTMLLGGVLAFVVKLVRGDWKKYRMWQESQQ